MNSPQRRIRAGDADRSRALAVLQQAYVEGRLDLDEVQTRQDQVLASRYFDELSTVLEDLPAEGALAVSSPGVVDAPTRAPFALAIMSGRDICLAPGTQTMSSFAFWGGNDIDVTKAMGPGCVVTLVLHACMGGYNIAVPPGVRVVDESLAIMAGNDIEADAQGDGSNGTLVLRGFLFWAGSTVELA